MRVNLRTPAITITLKKVVGRSTIDGKVPVSTRFAGQMLEVDLTPFCDQLPVCVTKSVREPAGTFSVTLVDRISFESQDSLYGLIEPMDVIEIRMAGDAYKYAGKPPILMRGFVSGVRRNQSMQADGRPIRRVIITGQDYGKIWQIIRIFFFPNAPEGENLITSFPFFQRFGLDFNTQPAEEFIAQVFAKIVNPYIAKIAGQAGGQRAATPVQPIAVDMQIKDGTVAPFAYGGWNGGSVYDLLSQNCDVGPWNELFIEDRDDGPAVVFRQNPFFSAGSNAPLHSNSKAPEVIAITQSDVLSIDVSRSDGNVANYFWVESPRYYIGYQETARSFAFQGDPNSFYVKNYGNVNPDLYGVRKMEEATNEGSRMERSHGNGTPAGADRDTDDSSLIGWITGRRQSLIAQNRDNVVFEQGTMRLKGNEGIKAGKYLKLKHGNMESMYYCESVSHEYIPFVSFTTTVQVERGTGFIDRAQKEAGISSPYYSELADES